MPAAKDTKKTAPKATKKAAASPKAAAAPVAAPAAAAAVSCHLCLCAAVALFSLSAFDVARVPTCCTPS